MRPYDMPAILDDVTTIKTSAGAVTTRNSSPGVWLDNLAVEAKVLGVVWGDAYEKRAFVAFSRLHNLGKLRGQWRDDKQRQWELDVEDFPIDYLDTLKSKFLSLFWADLEQLVRDLDPEGNHVTSEAELETLFKSSGLSMPALSLESSFGLGVVEKSFWEHHVVDQTISRKQRALNALVYHKAAAPGAPQEKSLKKVGYTNDAAGEEASPKEALAAAGVESKKEVKIKEAKEAGKAASGGPGTAAVRPDLLRVGGLCEQPTAKVKKLSTLKGPLAIELEKDRPTAEFSGSTKPMCFQCLGHDSDACPKTDPNTLHHGKLASGDIGLARVKMDAAVTAWKAKHSELVNPLRKRVVRYGGLREDNGCPALKTEENQIKELERLEKMGGNSGGEAAVTQSPADMEGAPAVSEVMHTMFDAVWTEEEGGAAALQHGPDESFLASPPPQIESAEIDPDQVDPTRLERGLLLEGLTKAGVFDGLSPAVMPKISSVVADRVLSQRSTNAASTGRSLALSDDDARSARGHVVQLAKELLSRDLLRPSSEKSNLEKAVASWSNQSSRPAVRALGAIDPNAWTVAV